MTRFPTINDVILHRRYDERYGDEYETVSMVSEVDDDGTTVYVLKRYEGIYLAIPKSKFLPNKEDSESPSFVVLDLNNKNYIESTHHQNFTRVSYDVYENKYEFIFSHKASEKVKEELKLSLNDLININNYKKQLGEVKKYVVRWKKDGYVWKEEKE